MLRPAPQSSARRDLLDGGIAVLLLALAVGAGYGILAPARLFATTPPPTGASPTVSAEHESWPAPPPQPRPAARLEALGTPDEPVEVPKQAAKVAPAPATASPPESSRQAEGLRVVVARPEEGLKPFPEPRPVRPSEPASRPQAGRLPEPARPPEPGEPGEPPTEPVATWPPTVTGRVMAGDGTPLGRASIVVNRSEIRADADGRFTVVAPPPQAPLLVKLPGYERTWVQPTRGPVEVILKPRIVKAAYLTYYGVADRGIRARVLDLLARTELNAVVIDVKGDRGWIAYRTGVELALAAGAQGPATTKDFDALMADLKAQGIYTIARIVTFKDDVLAYHRPDWAVIDTSTGGPWVDNEKLAWVDPFREEVWSYNLAIAHEAVDKGFDEIQFDYVRFPTDGRLGVTKFSKANGRSTRLPAITGFLERARRELGARGVFVAADVFGYTAFNENDTAIGQRIEDLAPYLDYICPMVYPSGYHRGIPGLPIPVENPYLVVFESVRLIRQRAAPGPVRVRPWLQDFRDYAFDRRPFGVEEIRAQIRGADEASGVGWMLWNSRNVYTGAALRPKEKLAAQ